MKNSLFILALLVLVACEAEVLPPQNLRLGLDYFPLETGRYAEYQVEEITYTVVNEPDTLSYLLREVVADSFPGEGGETVFRLERSTRPDTTQAWILDSIWTARSSAQRIVIVENNVPKVKLVFPFRAGLNWDANALNSREVDSYELVATPSVLQNEIESPLDSSTVDNLLTVIQQQSQDTIITRVEASETYAPNLGLVYKKSLRLQYCNSEPECIGLGILESGYIYRQTLIAYGKE